MHLYIGKVTLDSLLEATFKENGMISITQEQPLVMKVGDLEEMVEGFSTAFDEKSEVEINAQVDKVYSTQFDNDFGNLPFRMDLTVNFSNPIDARFLAVQAKVAFKGTAELKITSDRFTFKVIQEKVKVQKFSPYFQSETTRAEFEEEFFSVMQDKILEAINKLAGQGFNLPLGLNQDSETEMSKLTIFKDYLLVEVKKQASVERRQVMSHYSSYKPEREAAMLKSYPVTWTVDQTRQLTKMSSNEAVNECGDGHICRRESESKREEL